MANMLADEYPQLPDMITDWLDEAKHLHWEYLLREKHATEALEAVFRTRLHLKHLER